MISPSSTPAPSIFLFGVRMMSMLFIDSRSSLLPGLSSHNEEVSGLGEFDEVGSFRWSDPFFQEITKLDLIHFVSKDS